MRLLKIVQCFSLFSSFALALRGGILLSPLGKFNLTHDSPRNEVNEQPLVSTDLIGVTLSEPGMGIFGALYPSNRLRLTAVDFDSDLKGDAHNRLTITLNFRPIPDTVIKLDYRRDYVWDRVNTRVDGAGITSGMATYF